MLKNTLMGSLYYFFLPALPFILGEWLRPMRKMQVRTVILRDLLAWVVVTFNTTVAAYLTIGFFSRYPGKLDRWMPHLPDWAIILIAFVGSDFTLYWMHRIMHTGIAWRAHRWHHSPTYLYWLAGVRASLVHCLFFGVRFVWLVPFNPPAYMYIIGGLLGNLSNHWMHTNWDIKVRWLEPIIITPRAHRIHHSNNPAHHGRNFGAILSIWDHMFGTYLAPDDVKEPVQYGTGEEIGEHRMAIGL